MKIFKCIVFVMTVAAGALTACQQKQTSETRDDFKMFYEQYHVQGSFVLYDAQKDHYIFYDTGQYRKEYTPASTFKICNSLIGLEMGVIQDEYFILPWDSVVRSRPAWNGDQDLQTAFRNSTVWYYQELARRTGGERMKFWLDKAGYGNRDTSGGIDQFWLSGGLRISPEQQIEFLQRFRDNQLPFSKRSIDIVKKIMIAQDTLGYVIRAKTGWGFQDSTDIGWYVGYVETKGDVYYFVNCIRSVEPENKDFARARVDITYQILKKAGVIE